MIFVVRYSLQYKKKIAQRVNNLMIKFNTQINTYHFNFL